MSRMDACEGTTSLLRRRRIESLQTLLAGVEPLRDVLVPTELGDGAAQIAALRCEIARLEGISDEDYVLELEPADPG